MKCTQTEQFARLRGDNKRLVEDSVALQEENQRLKDKCRSLAQRFDRVAREEELIKNSLMKELDDVKGLKVQLAAELKRAEIEK